MNREEAAQLAERIKSEESLSRTVSAMDRIVKSSAYVVVHGKDEEGHVVSVSFNVDSEFLCDAREYLYVRHVSLSAQIDAALKGEKL